VSAIPLVSSRILWAPFPDIKRDGVAKVTARRDHPVRWTEIDVVINLKDGREIHRTIRREDLVAGYEDSEVFAYPVETTASE
jgi:hypothetical protein